MAAGPKRCVFAAPLMGAVTRGILAAQLQECSCPVAKGDDRCYHGHCSAHIQLPDVTCPHCRVAYAVTAGLIGIITAGSSNFAAVGLMHCVCLLQQQAYRPGALKTG